MESDDTSNSENELKEQNTLSDTKTDINAGNLKDDKLPTFGNPDKYGYDKIKIETNDKKKLEDEANAVVGSE